MGLFKKGYKAVREEKQRQDENREKMGKQLWRFFLSKDGDEADVRFLTEEPINFEEHTIKTVQGGKDKYSTHICTSSMGNCEYCDSGDKPNFRGAFLVWDKRPYEYTDKNNKKQKGSGQLRLYVQGARVLSQLDRLASKYGLTARDYTITRSGSGTSTSYMFDRGDQSKLTEEEISNMLPEKIRDLYDGTIDSLYTIVQDQLEMLVTGVDDDEDEEEYERAPKKSNKNLVSYEDEDEDDEDEDEAPRKSLRKSKPLFKSSAKRKPTERSVKPMFKTLPSGLDNSDDPDLPF